MYTKPIIIEDKNNLIGEGKQLWNVNFTNNNIDTFI